MENKRYILMLESDEQDREISKDYFNTHDIKFQFLKFSHEVIPFLEEQQINGNLPSLILLSMNSLPDIGLSVLQKIKINNDIKQIPVIILGENTQPDLIKQCYIDGVNTFINKPLGDKLTDIAIRSFIHYWFEVAELPQQDKEYTTAKF